MGQLAPGRGQGAEGAGDELDVDATPLEFREQDFEFAITDEGVSPDDGEVDGFFPFDHLEYTADEVVSLKVRQLAEIGAAGAKVLRLIGVTAGAAERALTGDLDRKAWLTAGENASPRV
jgi:hypothetical protein